MAGTGGAITGIGGNNVESGSDYGILENYVKVDTRDIATGADTHSDYVSFVAGIPRNDTSYPNMKWVTFDGTGCSAAGVHGQICSIHGSSGVLEVVRTATGKYTVYWKEAFEDNNYGILCDANVEGVYGVMCSLGGNNDATSTAPYYGISTQFTEVITRRTYPGSRSVLDSDYVVVLAF